MGHTQQRAMAYSGVMHAVVLLLFIIGLPQFMQPAPIIEPTAITVDILPLAAISNVKPAAQKPKKAPPKAKEKPKEITEKNLAELKPEKTKPSPPVKTEPEQMTPPEVKEDAAALPEEKPKDKPKKPKKETVEDPLDAILKGVKDTAAQDKSPPKEAKPDTQNTSNSGNRSNSFDPNSPQAVALRDTIHNQIYACWRVPAGARNAENLIIPLEIDYDLRGNPLKVNLSKSATRQYRNDPFFRAAADSAMRAVRRCAPLENMPPADYKIWQYVDMDFNPRDMLR